ncbi:MAG: hypothetical protein RMY64_26095 [Nostoc sp. DedQUE08]|uniref:hypothetical protein n=1 Tax=Nostoc sp. DedQUE08 TaxID=3075393 RepID=UPI002AD54F0B|nr:hypothetical protein [Nostoc sp. DedQUE08]MDZ8069043.1 hypothetical protein [Nostoc sp. DedQUE08]
MDSQSILEKAKLGEANAIAQISYDDSINRLTQPYVVTSKGIEIFRHATYAGYERFISWRGYVSDVGRYDL